MGHLIRVPNVVILLLLKQSGPSVGNCRIQPCNPFQQFSGCEGRGGDWKEEMGTQDKGGAVSTQGRKVVVGGIPQVASPGLLETLQALVWLPGPTGPSPPFHARP